MRILVVDDSDQKRAHVLQVLRDELGSEYDLSLHEAVDYEDALDRLGEHFFDLVILDLLLPAAGRSASEETSKALIHQLLRGDRLIPPTHIIGLTEFPDRAEVERIFYDEHLLALVTYDAVTLAWRQRLCSRIRYLVASKRAAAHFRQNSYDFDLVVLAARHKNEYRPIKKRLFSRQTGDTYPLWPKGSDNLALGEVQGPNGRMLRAALICIGEMGMATTAVVASEAINLFRPRLIAMVGMCCGFNGEACGSPRKLMDAIVVREVTCWEEGKYIASGDREADFRNRARTRMVNDEIRGKVDLIVEAAEDLLQPRLERLMKTQAFREAVSQFSKEEVRSIPEVKFAALVSGSSVVADGGVIAEILERHPSALGLDMEIFGLYAAQERCTGLKPSVLGVKGVADFGRADKGDKAQVIASMTATEVLKGVLLNLDIFR